VGLRCSRIAAAAAAWPLVAVPPPASRGDTRALSSAQTSHTVGALYADSARAASSLVMRSPPLVQSRRARTERRVRPPHTAQRGRRHHLGCVSVVRRALSTRAARGVKRHARMCAPRRWRATQLSSWALASNEARGARWALAAAALPPAWPITWLVAARLAIERRYAAVPAQAA